MGEKGNVASTVGLPSEVGDTSIVSSVVNKAGDVVQDTGASFADGLRDKATAAGVDATVEEARRRLSKDADPPADKA
jgi:hypothetical protein